MLTIYYGTNNPAKVNSLKAAAKGFPLTVLGINEAGTEISGGKIDHRIDESGKEPSENARIKAWHYFNQIEKPVFSVDSGLFFDNIDYSDQPGTHVRRVNGVSLNDDEMIAHYSALAKKYGGEITGYYKNAVCVIINPDKIIEYSGGRIHTKKFILSAEPHKKRVEGWPLDSLSKKISDGKYFYDADGKGEPPDLAHNAEREIVRIICGI